MNTITDDQIAEIEYLASNATRGDWEFHICEIRANYDSDGYTVIAESPSVPKNWRDQRDTNMRYMATVCPVVAQALIARLREAEREAIKTLQILAPAIAYIDSLDISKPGQSIIKTLIEDHKRLREAERDAARYLWILKHYLEFHGDRSLAPMALKHGSLDAAIDAAMQAAREAAE